MARLAAKSSANRRSRRPWRPSPTRSSTPPANASKSCPSHRTKSCRRARSDGGGTVMKSFQNIDVKSVKEAVGLLQKFQQQKKVAAVVGGGSEYLQLMKDHVVEPDYLINLNSIPGLDYIKEERGGFRIGALAKLADIEEHPAVREKLLILSDAAGEAASPQIRNAGTIAGNICQRPFCWYFRSSNFTCLRKGGQVCYTVTGDGRFHAICGGGPSYIVHPSDTAPALVALDAKFRVAGAAGERLVPAGEFFTLPSVDAARENVLEDDEVITGVVIPAPPAGARSTYHKIMDREAWTHAIVSAAIVLGVDKDVCKSARVVLGGVAPIPWRLAEVEKLLVGQRVTADLAAKAGEAAVAGARPLAKNGYKVPMTRAMVARTIESLVKA